MKHNSTRELFLYWDHRRRGRAAPDRAEIEPGAIRQALGDIFLLDTEADAPRFRLAGTRTCALFGRELKGEHFMPLWEATSRQQVRDLIAVLVGDASGLVSGASAVVSDGELARLEMLLLPLRHRGRHGLRAIGTLAPLGDTSWVGTHHLMQMRLDSFRHLSTAGDSVADNVAEPSARIRRGFVVIEGSRTP